MTVQRMLPMPAELKEDALKIRGDVWITAQEFFQVRVKYYIWL